MKIIAAINTTLDGIFDHTAVNPDAEVHDHYTELLKDADLILYGRKTYELMQFWQEVLKNPVDEKSMNDFAASIDQLPKIVFSKTISDTNWESATLAQTTLEETVEALKKIPEGNVLVGSRSLILQLLDLQLLDELQLCIHPILAGNGTLLFEKNDRRKELRLIKTKVFKSGAVVLYYVTIRN